MYLNKMYSKVRIGKYLSDNVLIHNCQKQGDALSPLLSNFAYNMPFENPGKPGGTETKLDK
jgi:hypothetical protein